MTKQKIKDLPPDERKIVRKIIKIFSEKTGLYKHAHKIGMGIEETQEVVEKMIDEGTLHVKYNQKNGTFSIVTEV